MVYVDIINKIGASNYSDGAKKRIRKLVNGTLIKSEKAVFRDLNGNYQFTDKNFRFEPLLRGVGKEVYVMKDKH